MSVSRPFSETRNPVDGYPGAPKIMIPQGTEINSELDMKLYFQENKSVIDDGVYIIQNSKQAYKIGFSSKTGARLISSHKLYNESETAMGGVSVRELSCMLNPIWEGNNTIFSSMGVGNVDDWTITSFDGPICIPLKEGKPNVLTVSPRKESFIFDIGASDGKISMSFNKTQTELGVHSGDRTAQLLSNQYMVHTMGFKNVDRKVTLMATAYQDNFSNPLYGKPMTMILDWENMICYVVPFQLDGGRRTMFTLGRISISRGNMTFDPVLIGGDGGKFGGNMDPVLKLAKDALQ